MGTRLLLTEGGVAGHMAHLYDNGELTFAKIKEIFTAASNGELEGTEKTDGQNLFISYSVKNGNARAARNKGNIKQGGLTAQELASKFEGRGGLTEAFVESFETFERAVRSLDPQTQLEIFGNDADIYYNAEIMDPRSPNVVNYDTKSLVIHQVGHGEYDKSTGNKTDRDVSANAKVLQSALETMQQATAEDDYTVQINAVRQLEALEDDVALQDAFDSIESLLAATGLSEKATINEYMIARLAPHVQNTVPGVGEDIHNLILKRLMKAGVKFTQVVKGLDKENKETIRALIKDEKNLLKAAIAPLEVIIHDFSVEMLRGLQSAFILDNDKEIQRLRGEVKTAIDAIGGSNHEGALTLLKKQMEKLKDLENVSTASEGFVFDYDGQTYKFTGNFAPINQILGLFKYGRGDIPAMMKEEDVDQRDSDRYFGSISEEGGKKGTIAVVPGAFKPPHRGHLELVKFYSNLAERVLVWISPLSRFLPNPDGSNGNEVTFEMAKKVWDIYLKNEGMSGVVSVELAPHASPVSAAYNYIGEIAKPGEVVVLGASTKPDGRGNPDYSRFKNAQKYAGEGVTVLHGEEYAADHTRPEFSRKDGAAYSASDFRAAIAMNDTEKLMAFLPDGLHEKAQEIINIINPKAIKESSSFILNLIKEGMAEVNASACGSVVVATDKPLKKKTNKYNPWDEDDLYEEEELEHGQFEMDLESDVGIPREEMPQIKSTDMQNFVQWLKTDKQVDSKSTEMMVDDLNPTQKKINTNKVKGMLAKKSIEELANSKPILVTADNFLVDGHHRWFALYINDPKNTISSIRVDLPLEEFLSVASEYPNVSYKSMVDESVVSSILNSFLNERGYENFGGQTKVLKVGSVRLDIEDMELLPSKHGEERRFRHTKSGGGGHKISKDAIIMAVDRSLGLIMNDYANGEISNGEAFHIRMKGKSSKVPALNVVAALDMQKGPDTIKIITVMRKDDFKTDNFGGGSQKTYNVGV